MARPHLGAAGVVQVAAQASRGRDCEGMLARPHLASAGLRGDAGSIDPTSEPQGPSKWLLELAVMPPGRSTWLLALARKFHMYVAINLR